MYRFFHKLTAFVLAVFCLAVMLPSSAVSAAGRLQDTGEKTVIVIDPGHGGENLGTIENDHEEKGMTLVTAQAMYDELLLYDDIEVYMTRTDDRDLTLKKRAEFAKEVDADFLFSVHYNASLCHELYGSEVWVSAFAPFNAYGYQFGCEFLTLMKEKGLFVRGVKTRLGSKGTDYYGIIRESAERGIPAVILEHCHVDEEHDAMFCSDEEKLKEFGRADATAVAKYFGLKSSVLQVDYSDYSLVEAEENKCVSVTVKDDTEPEICQIEFVSADYEKGYLTLSVSAADYDTALLYYSYSLDGGKTFSSREPWPECNPLTGYYPDTFTLTLEIPPGGKPEVIVRAYNMYDLYLESNPYKSTRTFLYNMEGDAAQGESEDTKTVAGESAGVLASEMQEEITIIPANAAADEAADSEPKFISFLKLCLIFVILLFAIVILSQCIAYHNRKKNRLQRLNQSRNDDGDITNQQR